MLKNCMRLVAVLCVLVTASTAFAEGFALYEYSARGIALGGAMVARKPDASAVAYNPALLTKLPGIRVMGGISSVSPSGRMDWTDQYGNEGSTGLRDSLWGIPHAYYTHQINDRFTFGIGEFSRFGLGFEYPHNWPGRFNIYEVSLLSGSLNPAIAWAATDKLSLALGAEMVYVNLDLRKRAQAPAANMQTGALYGIMEVDSNIQNARDFGFGFNIGAHYEISERWAVGLHYRSPVRVKAYGDLEYNLVGFTPLPGYEGVNPGPFYNGLFKDGGAHSTVVLPDSVAGGICWSPREDLSIEFGAIWTRWSTFRNLNIYVPEPVEKSFAKKHWGDAWRFNVGVEYEALDWLSVRFGYVYDDSPMTDGFQDYLVPTKSRSIYSTGVGLKWNDWTVDLAYAYIDAKGRSYKADDYTKTLDSRAKASKTNIFSLSLGYEF